MPPRCCLVTITDPQGIRHAVEVTAESLYEAGCSPIAALRKAGWVTDSPGTGTRLGDRGPAACGEAHGDPPCSSSGGLLADEIRAERVRLEQMRDSSHPQGRYAIRTALTP